MTIRMMRAQGGGFAALLLMLLLWAFALPLHAAEQPEIGRAHV